MPNSSWGPGNIHYPSQEAEALARLNDLPAWLTYRVSVHDIDRERDRQDVKWGKATDLALPDGLERWCNYAPSWEGRARWNMDHRGDTLADILMEEVGEALQAKTPEHLREELVQVAASAAKWIEILDLRADRAKG